MQVGDPPFLLVREGIELVEAVGFADGLVLCVVRHRTRHAYISLLLGLGVYPVHEGIRIENPHGTIAEFADSRIDFGAVSAQKVVKCLWKQSRLHN